jgi:hypothetical protein
LQHPEVFSIRLACLHADADNLHHPETKTLCLANFFARKKRRLQPEQVFFLSSQESLSYKEFLSEEDGKSSVSAQRQARRIEKIRGCCTFY